VINHDLVVFYNRSIQEMFSQSQQNQPKNNEEPNLVLGIVAPDSSISYYKLHTGLVPPKE
jgi:hypothetical protein